MQGRLVIAVVLLLGSLFVNECEARGRRGRSSGYSTSAGTGYGLRVSINPKLQPIAQARADAMARVGQMTHGIHTITKAPHWAGRGCTEGIGWASGNPNPKAVATCICGSTVVADAYCRGRNGIYRVRFFR